MLSQGMHDGQYDDYVEVAKKTSIDEDDSEDDDDDDDDTSSSSSGSSRSSRFSGSSSGSGSGSEGSDSEDDEDESGFMMMDEETLSEAPLGEGLFDGIDQEESSLSKQRLVGNVLSLLLVFAYFHAPSLASLRQGRDADVAKRSLNTDLATLKAQGEAKLNAKHQARAAANSSTNRTQSSEAGTGAGFSFDNVEESLPKDPAVKKRR